MDCSGSSTLITIVSIFCLTGGAVAFVYLLTKMVECKD